MPDSSRNVKDLKDKSTLFIVPVRRNSKLIDYSMEQKRHLKFQDHSKFYSKY